MTKRSPNLLHLTDAGLAMVRDGVDLLQPDSEEAQELRLMLLAQIDRTGALPRFIDMGGGHAVAACEVPDCPHPSGSGFSYCEDHRHKSDQPAGEDVADPATARLVIAAESLLAEYGGDVPDWLRAKAAELGKALEPFAPHPEFAEVDEPTAAAAIDEALGGPKATPERVEFWRDRTKAPPIGTPPLYIIADDVRQAAERARATMELARGASAAGDVRDVDAMDRRIDTLMECVEGIADGLARLSGRMAEPR